MKASKKICLFALTTSVIAAISAIGAFAVDKNLDGGELTFSERLSYALQGTVTGMVMVFAVLALLWGLVALSRFAFGGASAKTKAKPKEEKAAPSVAVNTPAPVSELVTAVANDDELVAVITAAIAAMIESGEYKNEFVGGFRVVSFKRSSSGAWNRK